MKTKLMTQIEEKISKTKRIEVKDDITMDDILEAIYTIFPNLTVISGSLYFWVETHYEKLENVYQEQGFFIKRLLKKLLGKVYVKKSEVTAVYKELLNDYHVPTSLGKNITSINVENGILVVDKENISLIKHDEKYGKRYVIPYPYNPAATAPMYMKFLKEVIEEDEAILVILEYMGYILLNRSISFETALIFWGEGRNGKSVLIKIISAFIGLVNTSNVELQDLSNPNRVVMLDGKLLNVGSDSSDKNFDSSFFKKVISGEPVPARQLFKDTYDVTELPRFIFAMNNLPQSKGDTSFGLIRRLLIVEFKQIIKKENIDRDLYSKLETELAGILNLAIEGAQRLLSQGGFTQSKKITNSVKSYEDDINLVKRFIEDNSIVHDEESRMSNTQLYTMFSVWATEEGIRPPSKRYLIKKITSSGFTPYKNNSIRGFKISADEPIKVISDSTNLFDETPVKKEHQFITDKKI